jgi:hypothetical protein
LSSWKPQYCHSSFVVARNPVDNYWPEFDRQIRSWVPQDSEPRMTAVVRASSNLADKKSREWASERVSEWVRLTVSRVTP